MWITHDDECWLCYVRMNTSLNKDGVNHCLFALLCSCKSHHMREMESRIFWCLAVLLLGLPPVHTSGEVLSNTG